VTCSSAGELHLLQARPIVDLPLAPERVIPEGSWVRDTAHLPERVTPLGAAYLALTPAAAVGRSRFRTDEVE